MAQQNGGYADGQVKLEEDAVKRLVDGYISDKEKQKKAEEDAAKKKLEEEGYKVGTDLGMELSAGKKNHDSGMVAETPNKDFFFHVGGRFQWDTVAWSQTPALRPSSFGDSRTARSFPPRAHPDGRPGLGNHGVQPRVRSGTSAAKRARP